MPALTDGYLKWCVESDGKSFRIHFGELVSASLLVSDRGEISITVVDIFCKSLFGLWRQQHNSYISKPTFFLNLLKPLKGLGCLTVTGSV